MKQSSIDWLINWWYEKYFLLSLQPTSSRHFIFGSVWTSCSKSSSNNWLTFSHGKEYTRAWCSWSVGHLSLFLSLGTFWSKTCAATRVADGLAFVVVSGFSRYGLFDEDNLGLYWAITLGLTSITSKPPALPLLSLALFLRLFKWISISCAFMHRLLNLFKVVAWAPRELCLNVIEAQAH